MKNSQGTPRGGGISRRSFLTGTGAAAAAAAAKREKDAQSVDVVFQLKGEVDDATGEASGLLAALEAGLRDDPAVISAKVTGTPVALQGAVLEFQLAVKMRGAAAGEP